MLRILIAALALIFASSAEARHHHRYHIIHASYDNGSVIGGRPSGCPHAFCGCSASLYIFGTIKDSLNLAANWLRFPHVSHEAAQPGMAAARVGHVMVLVAHRQGDVWQVHDGNSGGGLTRLHDRSIAGYTVVDPHGDGSVRTASVLPEAKSYQRTYRVARAIARPMRHKASPPLTGLEPLFKF